MRNNGKGKPPIRIISPGRVYRSDELMRHSPLFHQLRACCRPWHNNGRPSHTFNIRKEFACEATRIRPPAPFPYTEPSAEADVSQLRMRRGRMPPLQGEGWIEILWLRHGSPNVLSGCGIDPDIYSVSFGIGIERVAVK